MSGWCQYRYTVEQRITRSKSKPDSPNESDDPDTMKEQKKPEPSPCWGQVLYDFRPQEATEIGVSQGEKVTIHNEVRGWLFVENKGGQFGYIPLKFCTVNGSAPRRDPMELKVRLSKQGHRIKGVNDAEMKCLNDNRVDVKAAAEKLLKSANTDIKCLNNNDKSWCQQQLDNALTTNAALKHAIATPLLVAYARKSTITKEYTGQQVPTLNSNKTNQGSQIMDTMCPPIPDITSEISETSESLSSLEETSSVNSSQADSVRSDDVMDSTPAAFLPVMLTKNPDMVLPDDSTTDSGFSMDEDNEFSDSERYKQILKRKAVDVIFKQNLQDARKTSSYRIPTGAGTKMQKQTTDDELCKSSNNPGAINPEKKLRPIVPPKTIPFSQRISVKQREERDSLQTSGSGSDTSSVEEKVIPRIPVVPKPISTNDRPQGSTFLARFAVRRSSKDNVLEKGKTAPAVPRKPDRRKLESATLSRIAAKGLQRSKENLLETAEKGNVAATLPRHSSVRTGATGRRGSKECLLDTKDTSGSFAVKAEVHIQKQPCPFERVPPFGQEVKSCLRSTDTRHRNTNLRGRRWGSMECLLDRVSGDDFNGLVPEKDKNRTGSVECLLDTSDEHDTLFGYPSKPPGPPVVDLQGAQDRLGIKGDQDRNDVSDGQFVSIQTSAPNVGLVKSSQVLHTFRTWLDGDEPGTSTSTFLSSNGAISSLEGSSPDFLESVPSLGCEHTRTSDSSSASLSSHVSKNPDAKHALSSAAKDDELKSSATEKEYSSDDGSDESDINTSRGTSGTSLISQNTGATTKNNAVTDFESPVLQQLDLKTSAYLNADVMTSFKSDEATLVSSLSDKVTAKKRDNRMALRRVQSMKETSSRRVAKRRVDWGPCVQIHFYDPESEIDSSENHICRTTAMDFANTLEYEGSLV